MHLKLNTLDEVNRGLQFLELEKKRLSVRAKLTFGPVSEQQPGDLDGVHAAQRYICKESDMAFILKATQKTKAMVSFQDAKGNPTTEVENVVWGSSNDGLLAVTADPNDPFSATVVAVGPVGDGQVNVTGDSIVGEGENIIPAVGDVSVVPGSAATSTVNFGPAEEQ